MQEDIYPKISKKEPPPLIKQENTGYIYPNAYNSNTSQNCDP
jgi:hypothetical protein